MASKLNSTIWKIGDLSIEVTKKQIKSLRLSIKAPHGQARLSVPRFVNDQLIERFLNDKMDWIKKHTTILKSSYPLDQPLADMQSCPFMGNKLELKLINGNNTVILNEGVLHIYSKSPNNDGLNKKILDSWYRQKLEELLTPQVISFWEQTIGVKALEVRIKKMRTRWGSCNTRTGRIWLNLELVKKPYECIEYVLVHELVHLLERSHNHRFKALMTRYLPDWKERKSLFLR